MKRGQGGGEIEAGVEDCASKSNSTVDHFADPNNR